MQHSMRLIAAVARSRSTSAPVPVAIAVYPKPGDASWVVISTGRTCV